MTLPRFISRRPSRRRRTQVLARVASIQTTARRAPSGLDPDVARRLLLGLRCACVVLTVSVLARVLEAAHIGALAVISVVVWLAVMGSTTGPSTVMASEVGSGRSSADVLAVDAVVGSVLIGVPVALVAGFVTACVYGVGWPMLAVAGASSSLVVWHLLAQVARLDGRSVMVSIVATVTSAFAMVAIVVLAVDHRLTAEDAALALSTSAIASAVVLMFAMRTSFGVFDEEGVRRLMRAVVPGAITDATVHVAWLVSVPLVAWIAGAAEAGRFVLAVGGVQLFVIAALELGEHTAASATFRPPGDVLCRATRRSVLVFTCSASLAAPVIALVLASVVGVRDADVGLAAACLLPGAVALVVRDRIADHLRASGDTPWLVPIDLGGALVVLAAQLVAVRHWSYVGVAVASSAGFIAMLALTVMLFADRADRTVRSVVVPTDEDFRWAFGTRPSAREVVRR